MGRSGSSARLPSSDPSVLGDFPVVELRRYTAQPGARERFARIFETHFPGAFEQLGAVIAATGFERDHRDGFTWVRGFHTYDARAIVNSAFYFGPVWQQHKRAINDLLVAFDDVLLLRALPGRPGVSVLPAVDPVTEAAGARGLVVAHIFAVRPDALEAFARLAEPVFAEYGRTGVRAGGVLATLDAPNNFPLHPVRNDGPHFVWLGVLQDDAMLQTAFRPVAERAVVSLTASGLVRGTPELVVLDPTPRSRLRWLPKEEE
jgi:hypothetical protein